MSSVTIEELLKNLNGAGKADYDTDQMAWAFVERKDWPLRDYDEVTFQATRNEGRPEARLTTDLSATLGWLESEWPGSEVTIKSRSGNIFTSVAIRSHELGDAISRTRVAVAQPDQAAGAVAAAVIETAWAAEKRRQAILAEHIEAASKSVKPWKEWEVIQVDGNFHAVDHQNRLLGGGIGYPDKVHEAPHRVSSPSVLLSMRRRYVELLEEPKPAPDEHDGPGL